MEWNGSKEFFFLTAAVSQCRFTRAHSRLRESITQKTLNSKSSGRGGAAEEPYFLKNAFWNSGRDVVRPTSKFVARIGSGPASGFEWSAFRSRDWYNRWYCGSMGRQ